MEQKLASIHDISGKSFDFIIIGGGTAGLVLANRVSENPAVSVAVLEVGKAHFKDPLIEKPDAWLQQMMNPEYDWGFSTVPQAHAGNAAVPWSRGKGLGGSSAMNLLGWTRPQREDIDAFEKLGNPGWNFERFYEYSKKTEKLCPPKLPGRNGYQNLYRVDSAGTDGPIPISFAHTSSGAEFPFQKSLESHGVSIVSDSLGGDTLGTSKLISTIDPETGTRTYAASQYLAPVIGRPNLKVLCEAFVTRIITRTEDGLVVASGVEFEYGGETHMVDAAREVILSAGTIKSPNILELSGIGDREILQPLGISVKKHLPSVGTNVQEHLTMTGLVFEMRDGYNIATSGLMRDPDFQSKLKEAYTDVEGSLSLVWTGITFAPLQTVSDKAASFIDKRSARLAKEDRELPHGLKEQYEIQLQLLKDSKVPDIEIMVFPFSFSPDVATKPYIALPPVLSHPFSRGTIHINSADPKALPTIDPHYLEEDIDVDILVEAFKFARKVAHTGPFNDLTVAEVIPGPNVTEDDQISEHIKKYLGTTWHTVGSLSMLPEDKSGVVDPKLKVYGTKNIRVVDLSVVPLQVSAHTQALVYGIAELGADIIKQEYGL